MLYKITESICFKGLYFQQIKEENHLINKARPFFLSFFLSLSLIDFGTNEVNKSQKQKEKSFLLYSTFVIG